MGVKNKEITIECDGQQSCIRETEGGAVRVLTKDNYELARKPRIDGERREVGVEIPAAGLHQSPGDYGHTIAGE
jgi:hypothetical protein